MFISTEAEIRRYFPSPPTPLPEGEGRKNIRENLCFSTYMLVYPLSPTKIELQKTRRTDCHCHELKRQTVQIDNQTTDNQRARVSRQGTV